MRLTPLHKALLLSAAVHGAVGAAVLARLEPDRRPAIGQPLVAVLEGGGPVASAPAAAAPATPARRQRPRHLIREARAQAAAEPEPLPARRPERHIEARARAAPDPGEEAAPVKRDPPPASAEATSAGHHDLPREPEPANAKRATRGSPTGTSNDGTEDPQAARSRASAPPSVPEESIAARDAMPTPQVQPETAGRGDRVEEAQSAQDTDAGAGDSAARRSTASRAASPAPSRAATPVAGNPVPEYPWLARRRGLEGEVVLNVHVLPSGEAARVRVESSSGYRVLDRAALESVRRWRFEPALRGGRAVPEELRVPVRFELRTGRG